MKIKKIYDLFFSFILFVKTNEFFILILFFNYFINFFSIS